MLLAEFDILRFYALRCCKAAAPKEKKQKKVMRRRVETPDLDPSYFSHTYLKSRSLLVKSVKR